MKNIADQQLNLPTHAPVMVLPGVALFPNSLVPLYIFEPRYRAMLEWSLEQQRMFCLAPTKPGVSEAHTVDDFHHTVGVGLVRACVGQEDGTSRLMLQGLARVQLTGFLQDQPFRIAEMRELRTIPAEPVQGRLLMARVLALCADLGAQGVKIPETLDQQLAQIDDAGVLCDIVAHTFLREAQHRQEILEELRVSERLRLVIRYLTAELL